MSHRMHKVAVANVRQVSLLGMYSNFKVLEEATEHQESTISAIAATTFDVLDCKGGLAAAQPSIMVSLCSNPKWSCKSPSLEQYYPNLAQR